MPLQNRTPTGQEKTVQFAHTGATVAKVPILIGGVMYIPLNSADPNILNSYWFYAQVSDAPKVAAQAWSVGQVLYWDDVAKNFTTTAAGNTKCGHVLQAALAADVVSGLIDFDSFA